MKARSKCALINQFFECVVKGTGNQNSCRVSRLLLLLLQNVWTGQEGDFPPAHHAFLSVIFVCMTLLCSALIRVFGKSASSSLPLSSEKIFLQWKEEKSSKLDHQDGKHLSDKHFSLKKKNKKKLLMTSSPNM